jgi:hypothetical protein
MVVDAATRAHDSLLGKLLAYAASESSSSVSTGFPDQASEERQLRHIEDAGLTPLLYRAVCEGHLRVAGETRELLQGADLAARVRHGNQVDVATEVIDVCYSLGVRPTLLKGISTSEQFYPAPHLRPMGDVDILVEADAADAVETELQRRGYRRHSTLPPRIGAHHGIPLYHPGWRAWTEIHTALFPADAGLEGTLFSVTNLLRQSVQSTFCGRPVHRFTTEFQLAYLATGWLRDLTDNAIHPSLAIPLFDAAYLLKPHGSGVDWDGLARSLDNSKTVTALQLMLNLLFRRATLPGVPPIVPWLGVKQRTIGVIESRIVDRVLEAYLIAGASFPRYFSAWHVQGILNTLLSSGGTTAKLLRIPWNILFPPTVPERYDIRYQLSRMTRLVRGRS